MKRQVLTVFIALAAMMCVLPPQGRAQGEDSAELAKKLANPIASLISVPLQYNHDEGYGPSGDGSVQKLNIQPVIPVSLGPNWNLITRTIVPLVDQSDIPVEGEGKSGLGDVTASQFFSPSAPGARGWTWGVGPVELLPTASDEALGGEKLGLGPTAVALKQVGPWTVGGLVNHIWSVAGEDGRADINATFLQPFVAYVTRTKTTFGLNVEASYDWFDNQWTVPVNGTVAQMLKIGPQILQLTLGARYWAESPEYGPEDWGLRAQVTFLFPR